ncbi:hypothetical protein QZJ86_18860 [Methylomonas montana]|uniref:hypothetical protein n=1 Tax=Methylomonas montana TaxID=3058963 RepID=UPI00265A30AD|nr:hypothetical protein [Methylomonas montana]WKJ90045.1 hypothetical protein QZJ86_18860 [Methylomonas montana]
MTLNNQVRKLAARWIYACLPAAWVAMAGLPAGAQASYICPNGPGPGEVQLGITGGSHGVAAMPVCEEDINYVDDSSEVADAPPAPRADPLQTRIGAMSSVLEAMSMGYDRLHTALNKDPELKAMGNGMWQYQQNGQPPRPGEGCSALYTNLKGALVLSGPDGDYKGALMTFWGPDIPSPQAVGTIKVTLDQADGQPQTVTAFNYASPNGKVGAIVLAVPTIQALLDNMTDQQSFDIAIDGKSVIHLEWQHGLTARDRLRRCVAGQG